MSTHIHITTHAYEKQTVGCNIYTLAFSYNIHKNSTAWVHWFVLIWPQFHLNLTLKCKYQGKLTWRGKERDEQEYLSWVVLINQTFIGESYITLWCNFEVFPDQTINVSLLNGLKYLWPQTILLMKLWKICLWAWLPYIKWIMT